MTNASYFYDQTGDDGPPNWGQADYSSFYERAERGDQVINSQGDLSHLAEGIQAQLIKQ